MSNYFRLGFALLICLVVPAIALASDSHIPAVSLTEISNQTPSASADYSVTFSTDFGIGAGGGMVIRFFPIDDAGTLGDSSTAGFDFSATTFTSSTITATGTAVSGGTEYSLNFTNSVPAGEQSFTLSGIENSATEASYVMGLSVTMNPTSADFTTSDNFEIATDPCSGIVTTELATLTADPFGTNVLVMRSDAVNGTASTYTLAYATSQEAIDNDTATSVDMTTATTATVQTLDPKTLYYVQVRALDSNNCVLEQSVVTATTEKTLATQRYVKPTVKKIAKQSAVVKWTSDDYVSSYDLQLWSKNKLRKTFKNLTVLKRSLGKDVLKPGKTYQVRVRATYDTAETTRWSKFSEFTTKE